jgi:hypothetical protein
MDTYLIKPKYEQNVSERTIYINGDGKHFTIERYYQSVDIIIKCDEEPSVDIDCVFGANMVEYLKDKYPNCEVNYSVFNQCGVEYPYDISEDLVEQFKKNHAHDLTEDGWNISDTQLWGYTHFSVSIRVS